jgi:hypothetical protein
VRAGGGESVASIFSLCGLPMMYRRFPVMLFFGHVVSALFAVSDTVGAAAWLVMLIG